MLQKFEKPLSENSPFIETQQAVHHAGSFHCYRLAVICLTLSQLNVLLQLKRGLLFLFVTRCYTCTGYLFGSHKQKRLTSVCEVVWAPSVPESCQYLSWMLETQILKKMLFLSKVSWHMQFVKQEYCWNCLFSGQPVLQCFKCTDKWSFWVKKANRNPQHKKKQTRNKKSACLLCIFSKSWCKRMSCL